MTVTVPGGPQVYRASAPRAWEIVHTRIALTFNWANKTSKVKEWIKLRPYFYATDTLGLDAKSVKIDNIWLVTKSGNVPVKYDYKDDELKLHFGQKYTDKDSIELYLEYTAMPDGEPNGGSSAITDDKGLYFVNTDHKQPHKPSEIWTQGETESNSHWMITIDRPNTRFTTQVELTVPDSLTTLSNGAMVKQIKGTNGMRTDIWSMNMPIQAYAVMFAIGKYSIIKDHWRDKEVNYYVEPEYAPYARLMFQHTPEMMEYFSQRTGVPYPWNKYDQVVVRDYVSGAMENTTAALFGEFMNQNVREIADRNAEDVVSHELFHMWFGDYVTCESWSNLTVNESFANYGEQLWRRHKYGNASADEMAFTELLGYIGQSQISDPQLVRFYYDSREDMFDGISYNKGGAILRYLNTLTGDAAFDKAMKLYLTKNALHSGEAQNWRMAVEEATGQDWNWFFNEWYYHAGHPVIKVVYTYNDSANVLGVSVTQTQNDSPFLYELRLKTEVIEGGEKKIVDWNLHKRKDTFTYAYTNGQRPVVIPDYYHVMPGELKDGKKPEQWLVQYVHSGDYANKRLAVAAAGKMLSDSCSQIVIDLALNDTLPSIRRYTLGQLKDAGSEKYHKKWTDKVMAMSMNDSSKLVRADAFAVLGKWKVKAAQENMLSVLYDSSYMLAGAALEALSRIDTNTAYARAKELMQTSPRSMLEYNIWVILGNKAMDGDIKIYEDRLPYIYGGRRYMFAFSLNSYLKNVKSDESFSRGVDVYTAFILEQDMKAIRSSFVGFLFQVASEEKDDVKSENKVEAETAQRRLAVVQMALKKIIAAEKDPETLKEFNKKMKSTFDESKPAK